ncbi:MULTISPECIES: potassium-transporting ATPase subunit KdpB [unclassified Streptomyces]|uniref:potassium-transporting ATPase subunit KdpB n=1 Tax=unclassified Streptomyces TaxID=2593676 RepID=UPI000365ED42|nr:MULTISPECIES: potassium-transporting ATPase subunit KdpB [unclassified Streptomyces]MYX39175.1 potassium-transporting ATPase subunit KdpB [Streptomyces sp. SID8377]
MTSAPAPVRPDRETPALPPEAGGQRGAGTRPLAPVQLWLALPEALRKLNPVTLVRNPVMFVTGIGAALTTGLAVVHPSVYGWLITVWLWLAVVSGNLAEAVAESRGRAQADALRRTRRITTARRLTKDGEKDVHAIALRRGDTVAVEAGETIPGDGDVVQGVAAVDESAVTGESAPVIREGGGDRSAVTGGTKVLSGRLVVRVTRQSGESFIDRMIALVEGADRRKTPHEIALNLVLVLLTVVFLVAVVTLRPMAILSEDPGSAALTADGASAIALVSLLLCLVPTTIAALLSAVGIAGMDRLVQRNVLAASGRAVETAGDVSTLLLDKTGTITDGSRRAGAFLPLGDVDPEWFAQSALLSSLGDGTPEGHSIVAHAREHYALSHHKADEIDLPDARWVPFSATIRMSGVDLPGGRRLRKGAPAAVAAWVREREGTVPAGLDVYVEQVSSAGGTPLAVAELPAAGGPARVLGVIHLKDAVRPGLRERFEEMRRMGIRTVMVTGDHPVTARAIAEEAGVDGFLAEATPEDRLALIKHEQAGGHLVAMTGDGTDDARALAQADVGVAMNTGTSAARDAGNMVDLDSDPTKIVEIVKVGKQLLVTRGALTTFSIANDIAKYLAVLPAVFGGAYPALDAVDLLRLHSPASAILSAVVFNAVVILALIPLALRGVRYRPGNAASRLTRNLWVYGLGGVAAPFLAIKLIDLALAWLVPGI